MLLAIAVSLAVSYAIHPAGTSIAACTLAGGVCLLAGWLALGLSEMLRRPQQVLALVVAGGIVRIGIPFAMAIAVYLWGGPLVSEGFLYYLIAFYLVTLTVEIVLILPANRPREKPVSASRDLVG